MRTIESPGVEIREIDLSLTTQLPVGTSVFAVGYAPQGPTDELVNVTSISEFEQIYGTPTNAAERYFYHTCKQILLANATLLVSRMPYGSGGGVGFTQDYSALVFPIFPYSSDYTNYTFGTSALKDRYDIMDVASSASTAGVKSGSYNYFTAISANNFVGGFALSSIPIEITGMVKSGGAAVTDVQFAWVSTTGVLSADNSDWVGTFESVENDDDSITYNWSVSSTFGSTLTAGNIYTDYQYVSANNISTIPQLTVSESFYIGEPLHVVVDETTLLQWEQGGINWKDILTSPATINSNIAQLSGVGYAGMVIVNKAKTAIDQNFAGYYVAIADNSKIDKGSNFDSISKLKTINSSTVSNEWLELNETRLAFALSGTYSQHQGSISEIVETIPSFDFSNSGAGGYADSLILTVFKIRPTLYNSEDRVLDNILIEPYIGSLDSTRTINNPRGGPSLNFYLEDIVNNQSGAIELYVNPNISKKGGSWFDPINGLPTKKVRVKAAGRDNTESSILTDPAQPNGKQLITFNLAGASVYMSNGDNLYGAGEYVNCLDAGTRLIGDVPTKLERALRLAENYELIRIDIVPEAGLGTIWTGMRLDMNNWPAGATSSSTSMQTDQEFDDTIYVDGILNAHTFDADSEGLLDQETGSASEANDLYETIYNQFNNFCESTRKDCLYVADPLRYVFVQGNGDTKVLDDKTKNFSQHIFWPMKNLYAAANSSYACTYANWFKVYDNASTKLVWLPPSGWVSRIMVNTDTNQFPWYAPAGLNRGILRDVVDIGVNPTQRQRDLFYKNGINPTVFWPGDGYVIWGQKTLQRKPSAFDRINVRRLFLWLEKATLAITRYFVFEQNTIFTRERLKTAITPIFEFAKNNEGVYDYMIVCDERNNTPDVIDRNELVVDIYIKPVRVAEFILLNFIATRTGQSFTELI